MTITPCLWYDGAAEEAVELYVSLFPGSTIIDVSRYGEGAPFPAGTAFVMDFELEGRGYRALNGGPQYTFSEALSFAVEVDTQAELDRVWDALLAEGGEPSRCGWLKDRFGVSWQVVPAQLSTLLSDPDPERTQRVTQAMLSMVKLSVPDLQAAYDG